MLKLFSITMAGILSVAGTVAAPPGSPTPPPQRPPEGQEMPWPVKLGLRVAQLEVSLPVARQVVLVPDTATWLDEVARWSRTARWPVLIEDDRLSPIFIRAFKPERVVRRTSIGQLPGEKIGRERIMDATVAKVWGGAGVEGTSLAALRQAQLAPPGVVVTSALDDAWPAAVALAAGRGLPLLFDDGDFGEPNGTLSNAELRTLERVIRQSIETTGLSHRGLGDAVDAVAICRSIAAKCKYAPGEGQRSPIADAPSINRDDPISTTDALCRNDDGSRYAMVGWIFGSSERAAYMAMCSLFLERGDWWFLSGYPTTDSWGTYAPDEASKLLNDVGFTSRATVGEQLSLTNWRRLLMGGFDADVLVMNSSGESSAFSLFKNEHAATQDVPFLNRPSALHLIHSWSLNRPADRWTVGGRWLERGVYAYYGSVQEPTLGAFLPPRQLVMRWGGLGPFLISSRWLEGPLDRAWRLTAIGDPLMVCIAPAKHTVPVAPLPTSDGTDLKSSARERLVRIAAAKADADPNDVRAAMHDLRMLGDDAQVMSLWKVVRSLRPAADPTLLRAAAPDAMPSLFRERSFDDLLAAYRAIESPDDDQRDMLWQLAGSRVGSLDAPILDFLRRNLRGGDTSFDLKVLLPAIDRAKGRAESDRIVNEEMERTTNPGVKAKLSSLLRR
jgi:hypothetical protein